ncbi:hypothetical protein EKL94_11620 [Stenotrophomonas maltophilia]|uniref:Uncharacterized protein n=1 Tax=Stenotrophomonas maltophilia TaxID=40324 RepID=A0A431UGX6_STEMA|nr:hypothetical protein EKL94_11620 [Stenotrophomonas maltophilia]
MSTLVDTVDPRHAWMLFDQLSKYSNSMEIHPRMAWIHQIAEICQRWGGMGRQDRWRHGCRHRAPMGESALLAKHCFASARTHSRQRLGRTAERGSRRPRTPTPPRQPTECQLLLLLLLLRLPASGRHYQGAGRSPAEKHA